MKLYVNVNERTAGIVSTKTDGERQTREARGGEERQRLSEEMAGQGRAGWEGFVFATEGALTKGKLRGRQVAAANQSAAPMQEPHTPPGRDRPHSGPDRR